MKHLLTIVCMLSLLTTRAGGNLHWYYYLPLLKPVTSAAPAAGNTMQKGLLPLPRYQMPKGNVFCRMEDKLMKLTGVWITVGPKAH